MNINLISLNNYFTITDNQRGIQYLKSNIVESFQVNTYRDTTSNADNE